MMFKLSRTYFFGCCLLHLREQPRHPPAYSVHQLGHFDLETQAVDHLLCKSLCLWHQIFQQHSLKIGNSNSLLSTQVIALFLTGSNHLAYSL